MIPEWYLHLKQNIFVRSLKVLCVHLYANKKSTPADKIFYVMKQICPQVPAAQITIWQYLSKKENIFRKLLASLEIVSFKYF